MPLQNRVTPEGEIVVDPGRGLLMGNRGSIHRDDRTLGVTRWRSRLWIACVLDWKGRKRDVMPPGRWTALFFLDEVSALAAGHRPCCYCRRADYLEFVTAWQRAHGGERPRAFQMDAVLHRQRVESYTRKKVTHPARLAELPDGVMVRVDGAAHLWHGGALRGWSFAGYSASRPADADAVVDVLTPRAVVAVVAAGYAPAVHPSAGGGGRRVVP